MRRFAPGFVEKGGVPALISILAMYRAPPFALRLAITALASLVASCGAAGCEAVLEWNSPETVDEEMAEETAEVVPADEEQAQERQPDAEQERDQVGHRI